jgi:hypothetical protein
VRDRLEVGVHLAVPLPALLAVGLALSNSPAKFAAPSRTAVSGDRNACDAGLSAVDPSVTGSDATVWAGTTSARGEGGMGTGSHDEIDRQFAATLEITHAAVAGDVVRIDAHTWAIHGSIPVDGEVLLAEYEEASDAAEALVRLAPPPPADDTRRT